MAEYLGEKQAKRVADLVEKADFEKCNAGPEMKEVYQFIVTSLGFLVNKERNNNGNGNSEVSLFGGRLLSIKGVRITGRDVVLICLIVSVMAVFLKEYVTK